jgi:hypothetical protein
MDQRQDAFLQMSAALDGREVAAAAPGALPVGSITPEETRQDVGQKPDWCG